MAGLLQKIPYWILIVLTVFMFLAPFTPMPHVWEKLMMLKAGTLSKAIDIFDLIYHLTPLMILIAKVLLQTRNKAES